MIKIKSKSAASKSCQQIVLTQLWSKGREQRKCSWFQLDGLTVVDKQFRRFRQCRSRVEISRRLNKTLPLPWIRSIERRKLRVCPSGLQWAESQQWTEGCTRWKWELMRSTTQWRDSARNKSAFCWISLNTATSSQDGSHLFLKLLNETKIQIL